MGMERRESVGTKQLSIEKSLESQDPQGRVKFQAVKKAEENDTRLIIQIVFTDGRPYILKCAVEGFSKVTGL